MKIFRGVRDLIPTQINHRHIGDSVYGRATYYALSEKGAERYSSNNCKKYRAIVCVECFPNNPLRLNSSDIPKIKHLISDRPTAVTEKFKEKLNNKNHQIKPYELCQLATEAGYDSIILTGEVEGGEQLIIPESSSLEVTPILIDFSIWVFNEELGENVAEYLASKFSIKMNGLSGWCTFEIPLSKLDEFSSFFDFYDSLNHYDILSVDFYNNTVKYYDEED